MNITDKKDNKLWLFIMGGAIFVIVFFFYIVNPLRSRNIEKMKVIEKALTILERYEKKNICIHNEKWIKEEKIKLEAIKNIQSEYKLFYKERDLHLEKFFKNIHGKEIKDEALWEIRYIQEASAHLCKIKKQHVSLSENAIPFKQWKLEIPTWEEISLEQKRFRITEELINIISKKELQARYLERINFDKKEEVSINAYSELYDIIPITLKVSIDVENFLFLINEILKSKICFEIKTINISGELFRLRSSERIAKPYKPDQSDHKRKLQSSSTVDIVIKANVLDFKI